MKLVGELKKQVEETKNKEEAKEVIEKDGMLLTDEELNHVAGGTDSNGESCKHNWEYYHDSIAHQLMRRCTFCGTILPATVTSI